MVEMQRNRLGGERLESSPNFVRLVGVAADRDLATSYPGYTAEKGEMLPRVVYWIGGDLAVRTDRGDTVLLTDGFAEFCPPVAPRWLLTVGTTAAEVLVLW